MIKIKKTRVPLELQQLSASQNLHGITCITKTDDLSQLEAQIPGPKDSPYEFGIFKVGIGIGELYPFRPPTIKFLTPIFHPNIDISGKVCLDLLRMPPLGSYSPSITLESILISIKQLLADPSVDDPFRDDAADLFKSNYVQFERQAREIVRKQRMQRNDEHALDEDIELPVAEEADTDIADIPYKRPKMQ